MIYDDPGCDMAWTDMVMFLTTKRHPAYMFDAHAASSHPRRVFKGNYGTTYNTND